MREWLARDDGGVRVVCLPPYAPNLNLIERLWWLFKTTTLWNTHDANVADFRSAMTLASLVRLTIYTIDVDLLFQHYGVLLSRLGAAGAAPPTTHLGVSRLARPELMIELEGTAAG